MGNKQAKIRKKRFTLLTSPVETFFETKTYNLWLSRWFKDGSIWIVGSAIFQFILGWSPHRQNAF